MVEVELNYKVINNRTRRWTTKVSTG